MENTETQGFDNLTPDRVTAIIEESLDTTLTGLITPYPSYINRVYELETDEGQRIVAKFYRPGRWSGEALKDEHLFLSDCFEADIPVVNPLSLENGAPFEETPTLGYEDGYYFAVFPKKSGRLFEMNADEDYIRAGSLIGRIHLAGLRRKAESRITVDPALSTLKDLEELLSGPFIQGTLKEDFKKITDEIMDLIIPLFSGVKKQRIHGDCHTGNILTRPDSGGNGVLMIIDFDDMAMGPAVQDLLLLLPGHLAESRREFNLLVEGYEQFLPFDYTTSRLVEPLRAMRIIYFLAWSARQIDDFQFSSHFPGWGTEDFWKKEISDLSNQLDEIRENIRA